MEGYYLGGYPEGHQNGTGESSNYQSIYPELDDVPLSTWQPNQTNYQHLESLAAYGEEPGDEYGSSDDMSVDEAEAFNGPLADDSDEDSTYEFPGEDSE